MKKYILYTIIVMLLLVIIKNNDINKGIFISWSIYNIIDLISKVIDIGVDE